MEIPDPQSRPDAIPLSGFSIDAQELTITTWASGYLGHPHLYLAEDDNAVHLLLLDGVMEDYARTLDNAARRRAGLREMHYGYVGQAPPIKALRARLGRRLGDRLVWDGATGEQLFIVRPPRHRGQDT